MFLSIFLANDGSGFNEYLAVSIGSIISFSCGMHIGWTSPYIPKLLKSEDYPFTISSDAASYIAMFGPIGDLLGEVTSMLIMDRIGRRNNLAAAGIPMLMSSLLIYFSYLSPLLLYVARLLGGVAMGTSMSLTPVYVSEISRPSIRGKLGVLTIVSYTSGIVAVNVIGKYLNIYQSGLIFAVISAIFLATFPWMPESPYYLLMKDRPRDTENSLKFLRRSSDVGKELLSLTKDVQRQLSETGNYRDLYAIDSNRKALVLMVLARAFQQLTGTTAFTMNNQQLLDDSKDILEPQFGVFLISFIQVLMGFMSGNLADRFGRVPLMVFSTASCCFFLTLTGVYFTLRDFPSASLPLWSPLFLLGIFFVVYQIGIGSLVTVMLGEFFSASIKPKAICIVNITFSLTVIFTSKFYQISTDYLHASVPFYFFAFCSLVGTFYIKFFYPETKGNTLEEIQMKLKSVVSKNSKTIK